VVLTFTPLSFLDYAADTLYRSLLNMPQLSFEIPPVRLGLYVVLVYFISDLVEFSLN